MEDTAMKYHDCSERQSNNDNNTKTTNLCEKSYITDTISSLALLTLKHNLTIISDTADQEKLDTIWCKSFFFFWYIRATIQTPCRVSCNFRNVSQSIRDQVSLASQTLTLLPLLFQLFARASLYGRVGGGVWLARPRSSKSFKNIDLDLGRPAFARPTNDHDYKTFVDGKSHQWRHLRGWQPPTPPNIRRE